MTNYTIGTILTNKKNNNTATITNIAENGAITIIENGKERVITKKTLTNYYRVTTPAPVDTPKADENKKEEKPTTKKEPKKDTDKEEKKDKEPEVAEKTETPITFKVTLKENSLQPTDTQAQILALFPVDWEARIWACNKNMVTLYYKGVQAIECMTARLMKVSTRPAYAIPGMQARKSGYGMDSYIDCPNEQARENYIRTLISTVTHAVNNKQTKKNSKKEQEGA